MTPKRSKMTAGNNRNLETAPAPEKFVQFEITLYNPTRDPHKWAADVYRVTGTTPNFNRVRVHCGKGGQTTTEAMREAALWIDADARATGQNSTWRTDAMAARHGGKVVSHGWKSSRMYEFATAASLEAFCKEFVAATGEQPVASQIKRRACVDNVLDAKLA